MNDSGRAELFGYIDAMPTFLATVTDLLTQHWGAVTSALSMLTAIFAGWCAWLSYRLAQSIRMELKSDELLIAGTLHNPALAHHSHADAVIQTTVFNKSKRKAYISDVRVFNLEGVAIAVLWSDSINEVGNTLNQAELIGIVDSAKLFIRRADGEAFKPARVEVHHSFPATPLVLTYNYAQDWNSFLK